MVCIGVLDAVVEMKMGTSLSVLINDFFFPGRRRFVYCTATKGS